MIKGVGVDMCSISRLGKSLENPRFIEKVFTAEEKKYACAYGKNPRHFASAFAAKEALAKAGGWGIARMGLRNVWLSRSDTGPSIGLSPFALSLVESIGVVAVHVSVTHEGDFAVAVVVLEG